MSSSGRGAHRPLAISSPRTPDMAHFGESESPRLDFSSPDGRYQPDSTIGRSVNRANLASPRGGRSPILNHDDVYGGMSMGSRRGGYEEYDLSSPTHDYLEAFDSYPSTPNPSHTPIPQSPSMDSPALSVNEKDPLDGEFGRNQYASDRHLAPGGASMHSTARSRGRPVSASYMGAAARQRRRAPSPKRGCVPTSPTKRKWLFIGLPVALIIAAGAALGVVFGMGLDKKKGGSAPAAANTTAPTNSTTNSTSGIDNSTYFGVAGSGTDGSTVTTDLNITFTYTNPFGGSWAMNPSDPYSVSGKAQSWSPSVLEEWTWGSDIVRGVNLGGWLVTEPFIAPGLYEQYQFTKPQAIDEFTLCQAMGSKLASAMELHYKTFITEQDFADIASYGLNWVRIPLGFWAIETQPGEPFLKGVSWKYFVKAIGWARKYGIRILLDFHALPGSQNGWNHSGRGIGVINWMYGVMGQVNAQRSLEHIRTMAEFISQDGIKQVVPAMSLVNEVQASIVGDTNLRSFYYQAYTMIRSMSGYGKGNGPIVFIHEGFEGIASWNGFLAGADRLGLDQHPYLAFGVQNNNPWDQQARTACTWGGGTNDTQTSFGIVVGGEWSNAINNCGKWLTGVSTNGAPSQPSYETLGLGSCKQWEEWMNWNATTKAGILGYASANMDALQNWFFWTWKIGNSTTMGYPTSPFWHYKLGVEQGWMPRDPRSAGGYCKGLGIGGNQFAGTFPASATGAVSSSVALANSSAVALWPVTSLGPNFTNPAQVALFPTLTQTGVPITLPTAAHPATVSIGNGWAYPTDTAKAYTTVAGCPYFDVYNATASALVPTALCAGGAGSKRDSIQIPGRVARPRMTQPPT